MLAACARQCPTPKLELHAGWRAAGVRHASSRPPPPRPDTSACNPSALASPPSPSTVKARWPPGTHVVHCCGLASLRSRRWGCAGCDSAAKGGLRPARHAVHCRQLGGYRPYWRPAGCTCQVAAAGTATAEPLPAPGAPPSTVTSSGLRPPSALCPPPAPAPTPLPVCAAFLPRPGPSMEVQRCRMCGTAVAPPGCRALLARPSLGLAQRGRPQGPGPGRGGPPPPLAAAARAPHGALAAACTARSLPACPPRAARRPARPRPQRDTLPGAGRLRQQAHMRGAVPRQKGARGAAEPTRKVRQLGTGASGARAGRRSPTTVVITRAKAHLGGQCHPKKRFWGGIATVTWGGSASVKWGGKDTPKSAFGEAKPP